MAFSAKLECCKWLCKNGNIRLRRLQPNDLRVQQVLLFQSLDKNQSACMFFSNSFWTVCLDVRNWYHRFITLIQRKASDPLSKYCDCKHFMTQWGLFKQQTEIGNGSTCSYSIILWFGWVFFLFFASLRFSLVTVGSTRGGSLLVAGASAQSVPLAFAFFIRTGGFPHYTRRWPVHQHTDMQVVSGHRVWLCRLWRGPLTILFYFFWMEWNVLN